MITQIATASSGGKSGCDGVREDFSGGAGLGMSWCGEDMGFVDGGQECPHQRKHGRTAVAHIMNQQKSPGFHLGSESAEKNSFPYRGSGIPARDPYLRFYRFENWKRRRAPRWPYF